MRVLVTGSCGYIGSVLTPLLAKRGVDVVGMDTGWYRDCTLGPVHSEVETLAVDVRDASRADLDGFDVVMYLAALSNDPVGNLDPERTYEINRDATLRFARLAKEAGVERFLFSSSCSLYGAAGDGMVAEDAATEPVTPYGETKALVDRELCELADDRFSPTLLRNATAYGMSPRLRLDLVLNDLVAAALTTGMILMKSDGTPWRPLVHVEDICRAFIAAAEADRGEVHGEAFNVGSTAENYRIADLAEIVREVVPAAQIEYAPGAGPDKRSYCVDFRKIEKRLPSFRPKWDARRGARQLYDAFRAHQLDESDYVGPRYRRLGRLQELLETGELDDRLRWQGQATLASELSR